MAKPNIIQITAVPALGVKGYLMYGLADDGTVYQYRGGGWGVARNLLP